MQPDTPTPKPESPFFRGIQALADYLGVSDKTVTRAMRKHLLPYVRLGGSVLFRRADIEDALARLTVPAVGSGKRTARKEA
ncbi:MAG: helix-turn-helix domain-containing protein [Kiritimatiellae bacterium]|nr:helix-turn-helix domain-containing protein [Kiritimatiellia bacterium]